MNELIKKMIQSKGKIITFQGRRRVRITFSSLYQFILLAQSVLKGRGLDNTSIVGIIGKNDLDFVIADLACIFCGIKVLPLEPNVNLEYYQSEKLKFSAILVSNEYWAQLADSNIGIPLIKLSELSNSSTLLMSITDQPYTYNPKEVFAYKSTSGSTGDAKIMGHSVESIQNTIDVTQNLFKLNNDEKVLVFLPLNLLQQRSWIYSAILYGYTVIVVPKEHFFAAIKKESPTVIMGVPYIYEVIWDEYSKIIKKNKELEFSYNEHIMNKEKITTIFPHFLEFLGGQINFLWTGSAPISTKLIQSYFHLGIPIYQGYGMNETDIIAKNYPENNKIGSVGKVYPNIEIEFDAQKQLLIRNKFPVCQEYTKASKSDADQTFLESGWIKSGDVGYLDEDGFLYITGRIKEMIVLSNSMKVLPRHIEEKLEANPQIRQCVVFGEKQSYLVALIVPASFKISRDEVASIIMEYNNSAKIENQIFKFLLLEKPFSEENGLLSNQNKIKRKLIYDRYQTALISLYN